MSEVELEKITDRAGTGAPDFTYGLNVQGVDSGISPFTHTEGETEPSSPSNGDTWWDSANELYYVYVNNEWTAWIGTPASSFTWGGDRGLFLGGGDATGYSNIIDYVAIPTTGNATDFGDLSYTVRNQNGGASNQTRGLKFGGLTSSGQVNNIDYVTISTTGNANDFGDMTSARDYATAFGDGTYGICAGGDISTGRVNTIDYVTIATTGNASDFGDISTAATGNASVNDATRGVISLGYLISGSRSNTLEYVTTATTGNATDFGDSTQYANVSSGASDATRGVFAGGYTTTPVSGRINVIEYITIQSTGNATDFGDLTDGRSITASSSNGTRMVMGGGSTASDNSVIDYITIQTTGNAIDFGDLTVARYGCASLSGAAS